MGLSLARSGLLLQSGRGTRRRVFLSGGLLVASIAFWAYFEIQGMETATALIATAALTFGVHLYFEYIGLIRI